MHRILIVEDQSEIRRLVRWALELEDYKFEEASNGVAALAAVKSFRPDLVVMDVMMPGEVDGLEACRRMKADTGPGVPVVIMLSARAQEADLVAGRAAGADVYLRKPFSPQALSDEVARLLKDRPPAVRPS